MQKNLFIIIPVYNEEANIRNLLTDLENFNSALNNEFVLNVIFVDDGSTDDTKDIINKAGVSYGINLQSHGTNCGPGEAFRTGFKTLAGKFSSGDWLVTMEGDNTSDLSTLKHMIIRSREGYDVILASPYLYNGGFSDVSFFRMSISHVANGLIKLFLGLRGINTFSSFFRLYSGTIVMTLQKKYGDAIIKSKGFECMIELLIKLVRESAKISEVEMKVDWEKRAGKSKMKIFKTMRGYLRLILIMKFSKSL